jgi:hypothetical protein
MYAMSAQAGFVTDYAKNKPSDLHFQKEQLARIFTLDMNRRW